MKVEILSPGVIHFIASTQYEISAAFMRLQEFYESPYGVRGKVFSIEEYMDIYAEKNGKFSYLTDWSGFNVPGNVVDKFFDLFDDLLDKEIDLWNQIIEETQKEGGMLNGKYYVIGTYSADCIDHEHCHALWYLYTKFRKQSKAVIAKLPSALRKATNKHLTDAGYCKGVLEDETNAYLSTSTMWDIHEDILEDFNPKTFPWNRIYTLQSNFTEFAESVKLKGDE